MFFIAFTLVVVEKIADLWQRL